MACIFWLSGGWSTSATVNIKEAGQKLQVNANRLATQNDWVYSKDNPDVKVSFEEISFDRHIKAGGPVTGSAHFLPERDPIDSSRVKGLSFSAFKGNTIGCHMAVVEVNPVTGQVEVKKDGAEFFLSHILFSHSANKWSTICQ